MDQPQFNESAVEVPVKSRRVIYLVVAGWLLVLLVAVVMIAFGFTHVRYGKDMLAPVFQWGECV